jgi:hypothetical protein
MTESRPLRRTLAYHRGIPAAVWSSALARRRTVRRPNR